mgnify:CR=1 FL=1
MKKAVYICLAFLAALTSCQKIDHAVNQSVTYYPAITLAGGSTVAHQVGTPWRDPGVTALLQGTDITSQLIIDDQVDASTSGIYTVTYSYTNSDGFESNTVRTVVVYDVANASDVDIADNYNKATCVTVNAAGSVVRDWNSFLGSFNYTEKITAGPGTGLFYIQDLLVGFYEYFYNGGYGSAYAYKAFVLLNKDNTFSLLNGDDIDPWGDPIDLREGVFSGYDPQTKSVTIAWHYGGASTYITKYANEEEE